MAKKSLDVLIPSPPAWLDTVLGDFDTFLADHANCERKASALAMSMVVRYPDRALIIPALIAVAREELEHFEQVYQLMQSRSLSMQKDRPDPYANALVGRMRHGRDERFLDQLLVASVIESRGAERFRLIAEHIEDTGLRKFYRGLWACEAKHGHVFAEMALAYFPGTAVYPRLQEWVEIEAEVMQDLAIRPALH